MSVIRTILALTYDLFTVAVGLLTLAFSLAASGAGPVLITADLQRRYPILSWATLHQELVLGAFLALLMGRGFIPREAPSSYDGPSRGKGDLGSDRASEVGAIGATASTPGGIDYTGLDPQAPETVRRIRSELSGLGSAPGVDMIALVDEIILAAAFIRTSDIHIEPKEKRIKTAFRVDGMLQEIADLPREINAPLMNRLKIMSRLDISKSDSPQDGRIESRIRGRALNLRVSIFPTLHGEKAVIRVLDSSKKLPKLDEFGILDEVLVEFKRILRAPQGLILFTGPTGSGKTTLMYASLKEVLDDGGQSKRNIVTLEDPIEQQLEDVNQTQVDNKRGLTFAVGLRTLLRQDPDVIMVGEIRDLETAKIAMQAGQTGHLIISTLHSNSSCAAFSRLIDMGLEPFLLSSAISGIVAQRLVRRLCPACRVRRDPPAALLEQIQFPPGESGDFYEGAGCEDCNQTGFQGRMPIFELMRMNDRIADTVLRKGSSAEIERTARAQGMLTLIEDGWVKVQEGRTSLVELMRVVQ